MMVINLCYILINQKCKINEGKLEFLHGKRTQIQQVKG